MLDPLAAPVSEVMTTVLEMVADTIPMSFALSLMIEKHISGLPVTTEEGDLVGVLSWTDVMAALRTDAAAAMKATVGDHMSERLVAVQDDATVGDAASVMTRGNVHRVLVVDRNGNLAGLVSAVDIVRHLVETRQS